MTRIVDATLTAALAAGTGKPFLKGTIGYTDGTIWHSDVVTRYKLTGHTLEFEMPYTGDIAGDQTAIWLERGLTIAGVDYTLTTGRFRILAQHYLPNGHQVAQASLFPKQYYTAAGDDTYRNVISAFCTYFGKTAVFRDPAAAWLDYQFLPTGRLISLNDANYFANMLAQKYLIFLCDRGSEEVLFYSCAGSLAGAADLSYSPVNDFFRDRSTKSNRQLIWRDELETIHTEGAVTDPLHHLGFLPSTAAAPARKSAADLFEARIRPDFRVLDGDIIQVSAFGGTAKGFALVTEQYGAGSRPVWEAIITANEVYSNTAGGALPATIERVSNYMPLNTSQFNGLLDSSDNNLQAAMDTLDNHQHHSVDVIGGNGLLQTIAAGATMYIAPFTQGLSASQLKCNYTRTCTVSRLTVRVNTPQPAGGTLVCTLMIGGNPTTMVLTIAAGAAAGTYSTVTNPPAFGANQAIYLRIVNNAAGAASAQIDNFCLEMSDLPTT